MWLYLNDIYIYHRPLLLSVLLCFPIVINDSRESYIYLIYVCVFNYNVQTTLLAAHLSLIETTKNLLYFVATIAWGIV